MCKSSLAKSVLILLIVFLNGCTTRYHVSEVTEVPQPVKNTIRDAVDNGHRIGISLALINQHGTHYFSYGKMRASSNTVVSKNSLYGVGSLSKIFTALVFADMISKNEIQLDAPVNSFLPHTNMIPNISDTQLTLQHLITHTSGLPKNLPTDDSPESLYQAVSQYPFQSKYGEKYRYSNIGMALLSHILEKQSGKKFDQLVADRVVLPLNMNGTSYQIDSADIDQLTGAHILSKEIDNIAQAPEQLGYIFGGLYSNTTDLAKLVEVYLNPASAMSFPAINLTTKTFNKGKLGFNWKLKAHKGANIYFQGGQAQGYQSLMGFNPNLKVGVVLLSNSKSNDELQKVGIHLLTNDAPLPNFSFPKPIALAPETLQKYVGTYIDKNDNNIVELSVTDAKLFYSERTKSGKLIRQTHFYAKDDNHFFCKEFPLKMWFETDKNTRNSVLFLQITGKKEVFRLERV